MIIIVSMNVNAMIGERIGKEYRIGDEVTIRVRMLTKKNVQLISKSLEWLEPAEGNQVKEDVFSKRVVLTRKPRNKTGVSKSVGRGDGKESGASQINGKKEK